MVVLGTAALAPLAPSVRQHGQSSSCRSETGTKVKGVACTLGSRRSTPFRLGRKNAEVFRLYSSVDTDVQPKIEVKPRAEGPEGLGKPVLGRPTIKKPDTNGRGRGRGRGGRGGGRGGGRDADSSNGNGSSTMPKLKLASEVNQGDDADEEQRNRPGNGRAGPGPSPAAAAIGRPNLGKPSKKKVVKGPGGGANNSDDGNRRFRRPAMGARQNKHRRAMYNDDGDAKGSVRKKAQQRANRKKERQEKALAGRTEKVEILEIGEEGMFVAELAEQLATTDAEIVKTLFLKGVMCNINQILDSDSVKLVCEVFEVEVLEKDEGDVSDAAKKTTAIIAEDDLENLVLRPPVVTIMGHVDHGKTSVLDRIRKSDVAAGEAGGITQGIGAYTVKVPTGDKTARITFLDTPGHEAFSAMRARGARVTDIAIIVVAGDDGVRPQTIEAISHARAAEVPIIVAINKCDKPEAEPDRVKQELTEHNLVPEEWGGDVPMYEISAKQGMGMENMLEGIELVSEMEELMANPERDSVGTVIEAHLDKFRGPVTTLLVQNGTLRTGDSLLCGTAYGRVKAMEDDRGNKVEEAGPSTAVRVLGFSEVPVAGEMYSVEKTEKEARGKAEKAMEEARAKKLAMQAGEGKVTLGNIVADEDNLKRLNLILKVDAAGSIEAVREALNVLPQDSVALRFLHMAAGEVTSSDVSLASASEGIILAFNAGVPASVKESAEELGVEIRDYKVIYDLVDEVRAAMEGEIEPITERVEIGTAEVRAVFGSGSKKAAGLMVTAGRLQVGSVIIIHRNGNEILDSKLDSLRRIKDNVKEVKEGIECGMQVLNHTDWREGDIITCYEEVVKYRTLEESSEAKQLTNVQLGQTVPAAA